MTPLWLCLCGKSVLKQAKPSQTVRQDMHMERLK